MRIEFGWSLDGAAWADGGGASGAARLGPRGLVQLLQGRLGLTRPAVEPAVRIAQYLRLLQESPQDWPARSFAVDPWSTAAQLLRWRDAAVATGWRPATAEDALPERLAVLRDLERAAAVGVTGTLAPSGADDLREIIDLLEEVAGAWPLGIEELVLEEQPAALPGMWPRLLELLAEAGVRLEGPARAAAGSPELTVVEALDEWSAADAAARFLTADPQVTVLAAADTDVLDRALHRRGLPAIGAVGPSRDRAHHQVLGLFLDVATAPVDVHQLAALLDLRVLPGAEAEAEPVGLVPALARRELLGALSVEPGVGGPAWRAALTRISEAEQPRALEAARVIDRLVAAPLPADDLRPGAIAERLDWLAERLRAVARGDGDLLASLTQVQVLQRVLGMLDAAEPLARRTLQQIIDSCGGAGPSPRAVREVSPWQVTTSPAQVRSGTVLWWGPSSDRARPAQRWDAAETAALEAGGGRVMTPTQLASLEVDAALRGLRRAGAVVAVLPGRRLEEVPGPSGLLAHLGAGTRLRPEELIEDGRWSLAGRTLEVAAPPLAPEPEKPPLEHRIAPAPHLLPRRLSYTQIAALLACPHQWALQHALDVRPAEVAVLPTGARMIGTLVHAVVETLVHERSGATAPTDDEIEAVLDRLVPQLASELDLPGRAAAREDVRDRAVRSVSALFSGVTQAGLRITGTETRFELPLALPLTGGERTVPFVGSRDLDAVGPDGRRTVLDLKWSRSRTRYGDLFDTSEAIQLASYAWTLAQEHPGEEPADVGYFLLRSGEFVSADPELDPHGRAPMDTGEAWRRMLAAVTARLDEVAAGRIRCGCRELQERTGLDATATWSKRSTALAKARAAEREAGSLLVEDHCGLGDHAVLCGTTGALR